MELEAEEHRDSGLRPDEARLAAHRTLGNTTLIRETVREAWGWAWLAQIGQDAAYTRRFLRKSPAFTAVAVLSLAFGIGASERRVPRFDCRDCRIRSGVTGGAN